MKRERPILPVLLRSLTLRCPACGRASIVRKPFLIRHHCPDCRSLFKREEGFFVGAILANVITTEFIILLACLIFLTIGGRRLSEGFTGTLHPCTSLPGRLLSPQLEFLARLRLPGGIPAEIRRATQVGPKGRQSIAAAVRPWARDDFVRRPEGPAVNSRGRQAVE